MKALSRTREELANKSQNRGRVSWLGQNHRKSAKFDGNSSRPSIGVKPLPVALFERKRLQYLRMRRG
jgi:hypothetical protein